MYTPCYSKRQSFYHPLAVNSSKSSVLFGRLADWSKTTAFSALGVIHTSLISQSSSSMNQLATAGFTVRFSYSSDTLLDTLLIIY